ncbi:hypothetical protein D9M72_591580 [compost metagenome]
MIFSPRDRAGQASNSVPSPSPTPSSSEVKPTVMPSTWGSVLAKPKLAPEVISMTLLGPGEMEVTKANVAKASRFSTDKMRLPARSAPCSR